MDRSSVHLRAGEFVRFSASTAEREFIRNAQSTETDQRGFVFAPSVDGDMVLAASLTTPPGEYTVNVVATDKNGDVREAVITAVVSPLLTVPINATKPPVILLNGLQPPNLLLDSCPISEAIDTFGRLEPVLRTYGAPAVYFFDNCRENRNGAIEDLGAQLGRVLNSIRYDNGQPVPNVDLIGHSMGGLIIRSYLAGLRTDGSLSPPPNPRVRKTVQIATPNFGSYLSSDLGAQTRSMMMGSDFIWKLATWNARGDDLRGVDAIAIIGNLGYQRTLGSGPPDGGGDGVVSTTSASLGFARESARTRILPYCHSDYGPLHQFVVDCNGSGIAKAAETEAIIRSFLSDTSEWRTIGVTPTQDIWLSRYGGLLFTSANANNEVMSDLGRVTFGAFPLNTGGITESRLFYNEFVSGTESFAMSSRSLGNMNCGPFAQTPGRGNAVRCKTSPAIWSVGPLVPGLARMVRAGGTINITGTGFGSRCASCRVVAYPGPVSLPVISWSDQTINATLPNYGGIAQIIVETATGKDAMTFMTAQTSVPPVFSTSPAQLSFAYTIGLQVPPPQQISVGNSGGGALTWSATASATWISLNSNSSGLQVSIMPAGLPPGNYNGTISLTAPGATPRTIPVSLSVLAPSPPPITVTSVASAASGLSGAISPGELITIKGTGLGPASGVSFSVTGNTIASTLAGTSVLVDGFPAPITYTSAGQINAVVPFEIAARVGRAVPIQVRFQGVAALPQVVQVRIASPAAFTFNSTGTGTAVAANQDGSFNGSANPAEKGSYVTIYFTGGGQTDPMGTTGAVTGPVMKWLRETVTVTVGAQPARVLFAGSAPGMIDGVCQLNIQLSPNTPSGSVPIVMTVGGVSSPGSATLTVR